MLRMALTRILDTIQPVKFSSTVNEQKFKLCLVHKKNNQMKAWIEDGLHIRPKDLAKFKIEVAERGIMNDPFVSHAIKTMEADAEAHIRFELR